MEKKSSNALVKVRAVFLSEDMPFTLAVLAQKTNLKAPEVSMALCHLRKQRYVTRRLIANHSGKGRKSVWAYYYHPLRVSVSELTEA